ncbi:MAG: type I DNA topoisomerase, partial [Myxococcales bacterium]|nr:type I DNA topoisomerase [Myxococcales bacterium]
KKSAKKTATKKSAKKSAKKTATKKSAKKTATKKSTKKSTKKTAAKKTAAKKTTAKKSAKKTAAKKTASKTTAKKSAKKAAKNAAKKAPAAPAPANVDGKQLVIVESPAKAKTINKYLGTDFVVQASVGHIRDLPAKSPKGQKQPVPGVDIEHNFKPTYVILPSKTKTVSELKRTAKGASEVWFATDLDREGEAIAWHLAHILGIKPKEAKRVVFNAITKPEIERAFAHPRPIDEDKVNAQQARRILDRIVGYQASPLLWKKVARGLSAGRVQSVAVRLIVEREREIDNFVPDERWQVSARICADPADSETLAKDWPAYLETRDEKNKGPTLRFQNSWMAERGALKAELVEYAGERFALGCPANEPRDLSDDIAQIADAVGLANVEVDTIEDPRGKGPARYLRSVRGAPDPAVRYAVSKIETKKTTSRPSAPYITSTLQIAAANQLGFTAQRTMRTAQSLYEGVAIPGEGQVGLITYMRTDSTHLSREALGQLRDYVSREHGPDYLPEKANIFSSSNKGAQEAHEAIRPTDVARHPDKIRSALKDDQFKLYNLIWRRAVASQMTPARWNSTGVFFTRADAGAPAKRVATLRATGRSLAFDGFYKVAGVPTASDEQTLPTFEVGQELGLFAVEPEQKFSSSPPRYTEASLVRTLEAEGIGRPSTYASIIQVIQDRKYAEQLDRRFYATDLGEVVTDKLTEAFADIMNVGYTREMEAQLDQIEEAGSNWVNMLKRFYKTFSKDLESAHEQLTHAKAETQEAVYACPKCGSKTCYRFGKNGRFLSCTTYPDCDYAAPINREGEPLLPEHVDIVCPEDGSAMELRSSRFGPFIASVEYPETKFVLNLDKKSNIKYPAIPPLVTDLECPKCSAPLNLRRGKRGPWLGCSKFPKCRGRMPWKELDEPKQKALVTELEAHEKANPRPELRRADGTLIAEGTPVQSLLLPGGVAQLKIHPEYARTDAGKRAKERSAPSPLMNGRAGSRARP